MQPQKALYCRTTLRTNNENMCKQEGIQSIMLLVSLKYCHLCNLNLDLDLMTLWAGNCKSFHWFHVLSWGIPVTCPRSLPRGLPGRDTPGPGHPGVPPVQGWGIPQAGQDWGTQPGMRYLTTKGGVSPWNRTAKVVPATRRAVCLMRSRRRTFLLFLWTEERFIMFILKITVPISSLDVPQRWLTAQPTHVRRYW